MSFEQTVDDRLPGAVPMHDFVADSLAALEVHGFTPDNTLDCVGLCRDEICVPFADALREVWGPTFSFASLAGAVLPGRTAFGAFAHHAPLVDGRQRVACFAFTHVGIAADGTPGPVARPGLPKPSTACGALVGLLGELRAGGPLGEPDPGDLEYGLLRTRVAARLEGTPEDLIDLTMAAWRVLDQDIERLVLEGVDPAHMDAAVYTGVQVHGPRGVELIWVGRGWALIEGERVALT